MECSFCDGVTRAPEQHRAGWIPPVEGVEQMRHLVWLPDIRTLDLRQLDLAVVNAVHQRSNRHMRSFHADIFAPTGKGAQRVSSHATPQQHSRWPGPTRLRTPGARTTEGLGNPPECPGRVSVGHGRTPSIDSVVGSPRATTAAVRSAGRKSSVSSSVRSTRMWGGKHLVPRTGPAPLRLPPDVSLHCDRRD